MSEKLSPQGYNIGINPINTNPFFDGAPTPGGGGGVSDFNALENRPSINGATMEGINYNLATTEQLENTKTELSEEITKVDGIVAEEQAERIEADNALGERITNIELTPGPEGKAATIQVGTVETLEPGSDATVTNVGTENAAVLNFGIPSGEGVANLQFMYYGLSKITDSPANTLTGPSPFNIDTDNVILVIVPAGYTTEDSEEISIKMSGGTPIFASRGTTQYKYIPFPEFDKFSVSITFLSAAISISFTNLTTSNLLFYYQLFYIPNSSVSTTQEVESYGDGVKPGEIYTDG